MVNEKNKNIIAEKQSNGDNGNNKNIKNNGNIKNNEIQDNEIQKIIESLSPNERAIMPFLKQGSMEKVSEASELDKTSVMRALEFLSNKGLIEIKIKEEKNVELGVNGLLYVQKGLPERRLAGLICDKNSISLKDVQKQTGLNDNEFKAALGVLKKKALINLVNSNIILIGNKEEVVDKSLEEKFLESLPRSLDELQDEEKYAFENLKKRKNIIDVLDKRKVEFSITELGNKIICRDFKGKDLIEGVTPNLLKSGTWKGKKFRRYDIISLVPKISGGKKHFVNQATDYARKVWLEMGFKEMSGGLITSGFWNFDALFTAQDHPARELHDTFFIKGKEAKLSDKRIVGRVKKAHEVGVDGSKGWGYDWKEDDAKKVLLRTHTTCLSAQTLANLKKQDLPAKFFAVGKCFRNDTVDWSHGFEFNQTEGIVVDENANLRHLLGYLKEFARKMGYEKVRFRPHYFPYTEPSLEGDVWNEEKKEWMEVFAAGIFRPEVTEPLLGKSIPVLAWGPGFDRMMMLLYGISDLRELYKNDINKLREIKFWGKL